MRSLTLIGCLTTLGVLACSAGSAGTARPADTSVANALVADPGPDPRAADDAGLLLGLVEGDDNAGQATLLLDWRDGAPRLPARRTPLLVPRAGGWWWVGAESRCTSGEGGSDGVELSPFAYGSQALYVVRAGDSAQVTLEGTSCREVEREVSIATDSAVRAHYARDTIPIDSSWSVGEDARGLYCGVATETPTFVSADAIGIESRSRSTEFCNPAKYAEFGSDGIRRFESVAQLALAPMLTRAATDSVRALLSDTSDCADDESGERMDSLWTVGRAEGAWHAYAWLDGPIVCRGGADKDLGAVLPRTFTGDTRLPLPWAQVRSLRPNVSDAAASPSGRWLVLLHADSLVVLPMVDGKPGAAALAVKLEAWTPRVVMLRWAGAAEVTRWSREMPSVPGPRVRVVAPRPDAAR